jgi:uncharacterized surface protein with fasciclin (FAS1) repeats
MKRRLFAPPTNNNLDDDLLDPLYDVIRGREEWGLFQQALYAVSYRENAGEDLVRVLRKEKNLTVLAPSNDSISKEQWASLETLIKNQEDESSRKKLRQIVGKHIIRGKFTRKEIEERAGKPLQSIYGVPVVVTIAQKNIFLNKNRLQQRDSFLANNGIIHILEGFMV